MSGEKKSGLLAFVLASLAGVLLHFVYHFFPSPFTALFSPVAESVWEHIKLVYFPGLVASVLLARRWGCLGERMLALLAGCAVTLALGYLYCIVWGGKGMWVNILIYLLSMALVFWLPKPLEARLQGRWSELFLLLAIALGGAIWLFTFLPPDHILYADLSGVNTWTVIPY